MPCTIHKVLGIVILLSCFGCPQSASPITARTKPARDQQIQDKVNEKIPWRLTKGLRAKWIDRRTRDHVPYIVSITVLSVGTNVKIRLVEEKGDKKKTRIVSLHESAVPLAVLAGYDKLPIPRHRVRWTQHPSRPHEWSTDLGRYVVRLFTRDDGPPSISVPMKSPGTLTLVHVAPLFEPVNETDTDERGE